MTATASNHESNVMTAIAATAPLEPTIRTRHPQMTTDERRFHEASLLEAYTRKAAADAAFLHEWLHHGFRGIRNLSDDELREASNEHSEIPW